MLLRLAGMVCVWAVVGAVATGAGAVNQTITALSGPNRFSLTDVTITQGEQVTFMNGSGTHNVHFDDGTVDYPATATSGSWQIVHTFDQVGDFQFYCELHGGAGRSGMSGIVRVVAAPSNPPPGGGPPVEGPGGGGTTNPGSGGPAPGGQPPDDKVGAPLKVTLAVSDATPLARKRVRVFGVVRPARDGHKVQIQKRLRNGKFKTIATARLQDAGADKSTYSLRLRVSADTVLRARVAGDDERATGLSRGRKLNVHQPA
jgi:plastocyanin